MFAVNRGFPWTATSEVARMSKELLPNIKGKRIRSSFCFIIRTETRERTRTRAFAGEVTVLDMIFDTGTRGSSLRLQ